MPPVVQFGDERLPERFWSKVQSCPMSGCRLWVGWAAANRDRINERVRARRRARKEGSLA